MYNTGESIAMAGQVDGLCGMRGMRGMRGTGGQGDGGTGDACERGRARYKANRTPMAHSEHVHG